MPQCGGCGKFMTALGGAKCSLCPGLYHKACIGIPEAAQITQSWICPECKMKMPKAGNTATPVKHASSDYHLGSPDNTEDASNSEIEVCTTATCEYSESAPTDAISETTKQLNLGLEMRLFREELREVRRELKEFRMELFDMRSAVTSCNRRIDDMEGRLGEIEKNALEMGQRGSNKTTELRVLEETVAQLQEDLNERDQELLQADIEITNLPEVKGENPIHTVTVLAAKLGLDLDIKDVVYAERVGRYIESNSQSSGASRGRCLVVRLARRSQRDEMLRSARVRRGATTADMGLDAPARRFYVNERLTKTNRHLFYLAREAARSGAKNAVEIHVDQTWARLYAERRRPAGTLHQGRSRCYSCFWTHPGWWRLKNQVPH